MSPPSVRLWWSALPRGLLGMLVLVAAVEGYLIRHDVLLLGDYGLEWQRTARAVRHESRRCQFLCFGDSLVKVGISPTIIERQLGKRAYNLALSGGQAPSTYFTLRRALASGARPSAILVDFKWTGLEQDYWLDFRLLSELIGPREVLDLAWTARDHRLFSGLMLAQALPSVRARYELRAGVLGALRGIEVKKRAEIEKAVSMRTWRKNRGAHHIPKRPEYLGTFNEDDGGFFPRAWSSHAVNATFVERFLALAESRRIPVFWLMPPVLPAIQERREQIGADASYTKFVRSFLDRFPHLVILDARRAGFPRSAFIDPTHLDRDGTVALTLAVTEEARERLDRPASGRRWIDLPAYRDPPREIALEDVAQSRFALQDSVRRGRR